MATPAAEDKLIATLDGAPVEPREVPALHGGRVHVLDADRGRLVIDYSADVDGRLTPPETSEYDLLHRRPSLTARRTLSGTRRPSSRTEDPLRWHGRHPLVNQRRCTSGVQRAQRRRVETCAAKGSLRSRTW